MGDVIPLFKKGDRLDPGNYRPITLLAVIGKLFGLVINQRLLDWSEQTRMIVDEQGGFRPFRGTPDQIFLFRETLAFRKEHGLPTFALFVDVRKAYDTVWRESAYVDMHKAGLNGKLWRQLQAMHGGMSRRVTLPFGTTDAFDILRGAAQGAVESPWLYSVFINGLALALKARGFGVMIAGKRIPLLMYADDIVLLANSPRELLAMCEVISAFAVDHRFQFSGPKCGVMAFNVSNALRERISLMEWKIFGESVQVVSEYEYLGSLTTIKFNDWAPHIRALIKKAKKKSADLLWICRAGNGMRPRTAVALWNAIVRPILEYGAELWGGKISAKVAAEAEAVQSSFLQASLGVHKSGMGVSLDFLRAECGVEMLAARWSKLMLGYWRRLQVADSSRALVAVATLRIAQVKACNAVLGKNSIMASMRDVLTKHGLGHFWNVPSSCTSGLFVSKCQWKECYYARVELEQDSARAVRMAALSSLSDYVSIKEWGFNDKSHSKFSGEIGRPGFRVCESYLDDRSQGQDINRLKLLSRCRALPVLSRIGRERNWPNSLCLCMNCPSGEVEDVRHFFMSCNSYEVMRAELFSRIEHMISVQALHECDVVSFNQLDINAKFNIILGKRIGNMKVESGIDLAVKMFIKSAWSNRDHIRLKLNSLLHRND